MSSVLIRILFFTERLKSGNINTTEMLEAVRTLCKMELVFTLFNRLCNRSVFVGKFVALLNSILASFYFIAHLRTSSYYTMFFFGLHGIVSTVIYLVLTRELGRVPLLFGELKHLCVVMCTAQNRCSIYERNYTVARVDAVREICISEGGCRTIEPLSPLFFIDYYMRQVIFLVQWDRPIAV